VRISWLMVARNSDLARLAASAACLAASSSASLFLRSSMSVTRPRYPWNSPSGPKIGTPEMLTAPHRRKAVVGVGLPEPVCAELCQILLALVQRTRGCKRRLQRHLGALAGRDVAGSAAIAQKLPVVRPHGHTGYPHPARIAVDADGLVFEV